MPKFGDYTPITTPNGTEVLVAKNGNQTQTLSLSQISQYVESGISIPESENSVYNIEGNSLFIKKNLKLIADGTTYVKYPIMTVPDGFWLIPKRFQFITHYVDGFQDIGLTVGRDHGQSWSAFVRESGIYLDGDGDASNDSDTLVMDESQNMGSSHETIVEYDCAGLPVYLDQFLPGENKLRKIFLAGGSFIEMELSQDSSKADGAEWRFSILFEYELKEIPEISDFEQVQ